MDEIGIVTSFNPLDALESISKIYNTRQLSKVEILKIQAQAKSFNRWLLEQRNENKEIRTDILVSIESYRRQIERIIDMILQTPETSSLYKDFFESLLKANNELALRMSEIRIKSK